MRLGAKIVKIRTRIKLLRMEKIPRRSPCLSILERVTETGLKEDGTTRETHKTEVKVAIF